MSKPIRRAGAPPLPAALLLLLAAAPLRAQPATLSVDASEAPKKILHAHLVIPAAPGPLRERRHQHRSYSAGHEDEPAS